MGKLHAWLVQPHPIVVQEIQIEGSASCRRFVGSVAPEGHLDGQQDIEHLSGRAIRIADAYSVGKVAATHPFLGTGAGNSAQTHLAERQLMRGALPTELQGRDRVGEVAAKRDDDPGQGTSGPAP